MVTGSMTNIMDLVRKSGPTVLSFKVITALERNMGTDALCGQMEAPSKVTSSKTRWKGTGSTSGLTAANMTENGKTTNSMARAPSLGRMAESIVVGM